MRLVLIDGHAILHRAYHAYPPLTTSQGELVGAVYGFTSILLTVLKKLHPEYVAVAFDKKAPTFRHKKFKAYKIGRKPMDEELVGQLPRVHQVVESLNIPIFEIDGYEGDDVIGTLVKQASLTANEILMSLSESNSRKNFQVDHKSQRRSHCESSQNLSASAKPLEIIIVTGDQDALQLVDDQVKVYMPGRGKQPEQMINSAAVKAKYGLAPAQIVDLKALAGDQSDGIPGVKGIGNKTAAELVKQYGTVEGIYQALGVDLKEKLGNAETRKIQRRGSFRVSANSAIPRLQESIRSKLLAGFEQAQLSQELATIDRHVPIKLDWPRCRLIDYDKAKVSALFEELEFKSLLKKLPNDGWEEVEKVFSAKSKIKDKIKSGEQIGLF